MRNQNSHAVGAALLAALLITFVQLFLIVIASNPMAGEDNPTTTFPWLAWACTPLGFLGTLASSRPSLKGACLAAATYFPLNVAAVLTIAPRVIDFLVRVDL